ncbi:MAG: hypothetical protein HY064_02605 [Bacteroidetes bacterium]|nr:hypothetical protein [Bacteroidota bacterium]
MKNIIAVLLLINFFLACDEEPQKEKQQTFTIDSAFAALQKSTKDNAANNTVKNDTTHLTALPPVQEGDLIFQMTSDANGKFFTTATGSKYNNMGMIFQRPRDNLYMVIEVGDSVKATPLSDWVNRGDGKHVAVARIKNAKIYLDATRTKKLKEAAKTYKGIPNDPYFSWGDDAMYSSELIYKIYHTSLGVLLCDTRKFSELHFTEPEVKKKFYEKYNGNFPLDTPMVTPDDILNSKNVDKVFER